MATGVPDAPDSLEVTNLEKNAVSLRWKKPKYDGGVQISHYIVEKREDLTGEWSKVKQVDNFNFTITIPGLKPEKKYFFRVSAKNSIGVGEPKQLFEPVIPSKPIGKTSMRNLN